MPFFENSKDFRISGGRVTSLQRCKSDYSNDPSSKANEIDDLTCSDSSTGRMIVIGQGSATRVVVTHTNGAASRSSSRAPSRAASPKHRKEPSLNTQRLGQPPPQPPTPMSRSPSSPLNSPQSTGLWVPPLPDNNPLARSSQSQGAAPGSTDMVGFSMPNTSSPPTFPVPSPSMPFAPDNTTDTLSTSSPETQRQPSPVPSPVFGPSPKPENKISRSGTSSSGGKEEDKKKKVVKRFFDMWLKR